MLFLGTEAECGVCVCEEGGPRKWKWSLHDLLAAGRGDRHLSPSWSLLGGGESVYPQSSWALAVPTEGCLVISGFPACSIWLLVQILLCGLFTLTSGLCWSTDHLGTSASSLGIWGYLEPQDTRSENTLGPMSLDIVLSYCLLLCVVDEVSQTCSLTWLCLWELAPSLMCPGSLTPHLLFCPLT